MRTLYETQQDRDREERVKEHLQAVWKSTLHKLPIRYEVEWLAFRKDGRAVAAIEFKWRSNPSGRFETYLLALGKWMALDRLRVACGLRSILVVEFSDALMFHVLGEVDSDEIRIEWGGRTDRSDPNDMEPCVMIPMEKFRAIAGYDK
jgi:hypothetical protein